MKFVVILCVLCGLATSASAAVDREAFTFTKYDLDVRVEPEQHRLAVRGKITVRNDSFSPQKNLSLQISSSLDWRALKIDGKAVDFVAQTYASDIDHTGALSEAIVTLPAVVAPKGTIELEVGYDGVVVQDATRLTRIGVPENMAKHLNWDEISSSFTGVRGAGYVTWYPIATEAVSLSDGSSVAEALGRWKAKEAKTNIKMKLSYSGSGEVPILICNGKGGVQSYERMGRSYEATNEYSYYPLGSQVPVFVIANYLGLDRPDINLSYLPEHKSGAENYALAVELNLPLVSEWFGKREKPELKAELAELPDPDGVAVDSGRLMLMPLGSTDTRAYRSASVHQLTHTVFVSPRPWIYEGLAHFAEALQRERNDGWKAAVALVVTHADEVVDAEKSLAAEKNAEKNALVRSTREVFYRSKALCVWWMLREMIGDEALKKALATYHAEDDDDAVYMPKLIAAQSKRELDWFFDDWVYHDRGLPDFHLVSVALQAVSGGGYVVAVTVDNLGTAGADVPVIVKMDAGEVAGKIDVRAKSRNAVRIEVPERPQMVVINDGSVPESDMSNNTYQIAPVTK